MGIAGVKGQVDSYHSSMRKPPDEWMQAALFIRDHKSPSDTMFTWGFRPKLYRIADSHTVTRWASAHYILDSPDAYNWIGGELMAELRATPPNFVVYDCNDSLAKAGNTVRNQFMEFVSKEYRVVYRTAGVCVSQRGSSACKQRSSPDREWLCGANSLVRGRGTKPSSLRGCSVCGPEKPVDCEPETSDLLPIGRSENPQPNL
jgi:hypothetical protein